MDCIKVDRSLIKSFTDHPELKTIIRAIATVAEGLKLHLIAEGVETKEQLELIKKIFTDLLFMVFLGHIGLQYHLLSQKNNLHLFYLETFVPING